MRSDISIYLFDFLPSKSSSYSLKKPFCCPSCKKLLEERQRIAVTWKMKSAELAVVHREDFLSMRFPLSSNNSQRLSISRWKVHKDIVTANETIQRLTRIRGRESVAFADMFTCSSVKLNIRGLNYAKDPNAPIRIR